jgi:hypothetical protein
MLIFSQSFSVILSFSDLPFVIDKSVVVFRIIDLTRTPPFFLLQQPAFLFSHTFEIVYITY